jgi:arylformamidase
MKPTLSRSLVAACLILFSCQTATAGILRDLLARRDASQPITLPADVQTLHDIAYGSDQRQRFDVYLPPHAQNAPVIFMVHGGGWRTGDKKSGAVVENKAARWLPRGFIFISVNYRLLPTDPLQQADDVAHALAAAQAKAATWGGDPSRFILMGHSAGAHLVALLSADPARAFKVGAKPWLGSILLDSAALNVEKIMEGRHFRLYDDAFGNQPAYWRSASPFDLLTPKAPPMLAVCSTRRKDSCPQAQDFVAKAGSLGVRAQVLPEDFSHREINELLGKDPVYTRAVETFMGSLDASVKDLLETSMTTTP